MGKSGEALFCQDFSLVRFFSSIGKEMNDQVANGGDDLIFLKSVKGQEHKKHNHFYP
jgi:hypothetical protein